MNVKNQKSKDNMPKGKGFYISLAICLTAVTAAGWSTYRGVKEFNKPPKSHIARKDIDHISTPEIKSSQEGNTVSSILENEPMQDNKVKESKSTNTLKSNSKENELQEIQSVSSDQVDTLIVYPTNKTIIKEFSDGKPVYSKTLGDWRVHDGTDFKAEKGSIVKSIASGTVKDVYNDPSLGTTIAIEHNAEFIAYYSGLGNTTLVNKGDKVKSGQDIGSINTVPIEIADESHLHFMIEKNGKFIDPILILEQDAD